MHKDLSDGWREDIEDNANWVARHLAYEDQSLALAREAWINAFDRAAEELDAQ